MPDAPSSLEKPRESAARRCPACGQPLKRAADGRCGLCGLQVDERPITSEDATPFAKPVENASESASAMCRWVFSASAERISHLGLMRASESSRRFARGSLLYFALAAAVWQFQAAGWKLLKPHLLTDAEAMQPAGDGWLLVAESDSQVAAIQKRPSALWWNPAAAAIVVTACFCIQLLAGLLWSHWLYLGSQGCLPTAQRNHDRLSCALHYGTAWVRPAALTLLLLVFKPLADVAWVKNWAAPW